MSSHNNTARLPQLDDCWNRFGVWGNEQPRCPELERVVHCRNCEHFSAASRLMLEKPIPEEYRRQWTERFAQPPQQVETCLESALLFRLGDEWLALASCFVKEITAMKTIQSLPNQPSALVKGLVNMRGELQICVSLGTLLGLERASGEHADGPEIFERLIHAVHDGQCFVFPVSEVEGIHHYAPSAVRPVPATVSKASTSYTTGILDWKDRHIGILDHELLFYALAKGLT